MIGVPADAAALAAEVEVRAEFERYEAALVAGDVETMTSQFWASPDVVHFGLADMQVGADELAAWRKAQPPLPAGRRLTDTRVTAFGPDVVVVTTCFGYPGRVEIGRQSQVWARLDEGWRIVSAHVSEVPDHGTA